MQVSVQRPVGDKGMMVIRRANDHCVQPLVVQALPPVNVCFGIWKSLLSLGETSFVYITQGDDVFVGECVEESKSSAPTAEQRNIEFVVRLCTFIGLGK